MTKALQIILIVLVVIYAGLLLSHLRKTSDAKAVCVDKYDDDFEHADSLHILFTTPRDEYINNCIKNLAR